jgi:anti-repressor protein
MDDISKKIVFREISTDLVAKTGEINFPVKQLSDSISLSFSRADFEHPNSFRVPQTYLEAIRQIIANEEINYKLRTENLLLSLENEEIKKKAEMYDRFLGTRNAFDMKQVANVFGVGRNKLFALLRKTNILLDEGPNHNLPYQKYIDAGYFIVRKVIIPRTNGDQIKDQTLVTPKGIGFIDRVLQNKFFNIGNLSGKNLTEPAQYYN